MKGSSGLNFKTNDMEKYNSDEPLTDRSQMPFGKYRGRNMANVPSHYLLWIYEQEWIEKWPNVMQYIEDNSDVLEMESKNPRDER